MSASDPAFSPNSASCLQPFNEKGIALEPETEISADLNIDSVSVMDFVMEVEDHFDIDIPLNVLSETRIDRRSGEGRRGAHLREGVSSMIDLLEKHRGSVRAPWAHAGRFGRQCGGRDQ